MYSLKINFKIFLSVRLNEEATLEWILKIILQLYLIGQNQVLHLKISTTLMDNGDAYSAATDEIVKYANDKQIDVIVGPEARGFIIGCPVAYALGSVLHLFVKKENYRVK